jgi:recombination protein RecR
VQKLPQALQTVVEQLAGLPGVGRKSALRMGLVLLHWPEEKVHSLGRSIIDLRRSLCLCSRCGSITDADPCSICSDPARRDDELCLVADWDALLTVEESGYFRGKYLVLGGLLSPLDGVQSSHLDLDRLRRRLKEGNVEEVIMALGTMKESETTESYVTGLIRSEFPGLRVSRLAQGIPVGSDLKYVDRETLKQSLSHRQEM